MSIRQVFENNQKCFIPFVTAGHPDLETTRDIIIRLAEIGCHIVEIGIPFSDPIADGPIIQRSSFDALRHGYGMNDYLSLVRELRGSTSIGLLFMTYLNPALRFGLQELDELGAAAGLDGLLISDLTPEEYLQFPSARKVSRLERVFLVAPTSSEERLGRICEVSTGFVYLIARTGVTGQHTNIGESFRKDVERIRYRTSLPVAAGFGISSAADVRRVWEHADGAIVGSAIVRYIEEHRDDPQLADKVGEYVRNHLIPSD